MLAALRAYAGPGPKLAAVILDFAGLPLWRRKLRKNVAAGLACADRIGWVGRPWPQAGWRAARAGKMRTDGFLLPPFSKGGQGGL